jgi:hypothetical protein
MEAHDGVTKAEAAEQAQRVVIESARALLFSPNLDSLYRRAVKQVREKLGIERCGLFLKDHDTGEVHGTYGTDRHGNTVDEHNNRFALNDWWEHVFRPRENEAGEWEVIDGERVEWDGEKRVALEPGWLAVTPICSPKTEGKPIGVFISDSYLSGSVPNPILQDALALYCTMLANLILVKRLEDERADHMQLETSLGRIREKIVSIREFSNTDEPWTLIPEEIRALGIPLLGMSLEVPAPDKGSFRCFLIPRLGPSFAEFPFFVY